MHYILILSCFLICYHNLDRSSTRLHAPPGGKSNLSLGDGSSDRDRFSGRNSNVPQQSPTTYYEPSNMKKNQAPMSSQAAMDPKLLAYMETLNPDERAIFEQMVNEEMDNLSSNLKSTHIDSNMGGGYAPSNDQNYGNSRSREGATGAGPQGRNTDRQQTMDKQTTYRNQLSEAASQPPISDQRVSLVSQRKMKEQQLNQRGYSDDSENPLLNIGTKKNYGGSPRG